MAQADGVHSLLGTLYAAPLQPEMWNVFLSQLSQMSGVNKAALIAHDAPADDHRMLAIFGDSVEESIPSYERHYYQFDEWAQRLPNRRLGRFILGEELWPVEALKRSTYFHEFLEPRDVCQMACIAALGGLGLFESLSVYRGPREEPFGDGLLRTLDALAPHIETALRTRRRLIGLESRVGELETVLNAMSGAVLLLNGKGECVFVNKAAKSILDERSGLCLERSLLAVLNARDSMKLREAIDLAIATGHGKSQRVAGAVSIARHGRRALHVIASPFLPGGTVFTGKAAAIVFLHDPERMAAVPSEVLKMLFGLTASESRLAVSLVDGRSLAEAADTHCVSQETVRSQVKSIFQKTGTRRQGELIGLLAGIVTPRL